MPDAVSRYCAASERGDLDAIMATLAPGAGLVSPLSGKMVFRGHEDLRILLTAVHGSIGDLRWVQQIGEGSDTRVAVAEGRVAGVRLGDAMLFELDGSGLIRLIRPHLRPWLATSLFALSLAPQMARHPGVIVRALRR